MKCKRVKRLLSSYMDHALPEEKYNAIKLHLESCPVCQEHVSELENLWKVLDVIPSMPDNPYFAQRVLARIREKASEQSSFLDQLERFWVPVATALAVLLGIWIGYLAGGNGEALGYENGNSTTIGTGYIETLAHLSSASLGEEYISLNTEFGEEGSP